MTSFAKVVLFKQVGDMDVLRAANDDRLYPLVSITAPDAAATGAGSALLDGGKETRFSPAIPMASLGFGLFKLLAYDFCRLDSTFPFYMRGGPNFHLAVVDPF